jgi:hypothetical protein
MWMIENRPLQFISYILIGTFRVTLEIDHTEGNAGLTHVQGVKIN